MQLPARGGTTFSRLRRNAGKGGTRTRTLPAAPRRRPAPTFHPERGRGRQTQRPSSTRVHAAWRPELSPARPAGHSLPRRRHTPLASPHAPSLASHFPPTPKLAPPHTRRRAPSQGGRSPGSGREITEFNDTLGFLYSLSSP